MTAVFRRFRRSLALICAIVMFFTSVYSAPVSVNSADAGEPYITHDGNKASAVTLPQDGKVRLIANANERAAYAWQIRNPKQEEQWININDANGSTLWVTYALVGSMLQSNGTAMLRCAVTENEETVYTDPVTVTVSFTPSMDKPMPETFQAGGAPMMFAARPATEEEAGEDVYKTHTIIINYLFDDNTLAFEPYGASIPAGEDFYDVIPSHLIPGYEPFRWVGDSYVKATEVELNITNIQENIVINVIYEPALVNFSVHHHLQNLYDDGYSLHPDYTTASQAITGTVVGDGLALSEDVLPGFRALAYDRLTVAADGSTVVEIRYDRNYYLIDFDMNGGYGTEPVYTRYGAPVSANDPIRHGYVFDGWELVTYDGRTPTAEEASRYAISATKGITVPAANLCYRARWITQQTTYTMVFWKENAGDDGYSYWGYLPNLAAMSGSVVSAQNWASQAPDIDDAGYFTFNSEKSDKNVLVEGDGSTVVNVYYTRNYYNITFVAPGTCIIPEKHTHNDDCYELICGGGAHTHTDECGSELICQIPEHTAHTEECVICGVEEHIHGSVGCDCRIAEHSHTVTCWGSGVGDLGSPNKPPSNPQNGQVARSGIRYYIYLLGSWYRYSSYGASNGDIVDPSCGKTEHVHGTNCNCNKQEHSHADSCYRDTLHSHTMACYRYNCGQENHTHVAACRRLSCAMPTGHTHNSDCNSSSRNSTVKIVRRKYQESIGDLWPVKDEHGKEYKSGQRWTPSNSSYYSAVLVYLSRMVPDDFTLTLSTSSADTYVMNYYLQVLPGETFDRTEYGKNYRLSHTVTANYNYITYAEDFFEISGYDRYASNPKFNSSNQIDLTGGGNVDFFYDRSTDNPLTFSNNGIIMEDKTVYEVAYQAPLKHYEFEPEYPSNLEPGAYTFSGWYTSPGCFDGTKVNWDSLRMEEGGLQLYAKWTPITHRVRVFKDASLQEQIGQDQTIPHKSFAHAPEGNVTNGNYVFQGWFYKENVNGTEVEKAFVFTGIPITKDLDIYAKWSSHTSVRYRIEYRLQTTEEEIADPTEGVAIAGNNKTFPAKAGVELYPGYQSGFYPLVNSHTITMSADGDHVFTFYYIYVESVPYKVRYVDSLTGAELLPTKVVVDNTLSVVTETFQRIDGKMPDAYQKRLVLVAEGSGEDENGVLNENVITFYYSSDEKHAYYRVVHYIENMSGGDYREYRSEEAVGNINQVYTFETLTLAGFSFDGSLTKVNGVSAPVDGAEVSATLGGNGLLVELYYRRSTVPYTVRYLNALTGEEIFTAKTGSDVFGQLIAEYALDLSGLGYELIGEGVRTLTLSANPDYNVLEFQYQEKIVSLKYQIVGPVGCGSLSQMSQNVQAISGKAGGSVPEIKNGFVFMGWYLDEACTQPVPESWVDPTNQKLTPMKTAAVWQNATYYAKVIALETDLTIQVQGSDYRDESQTFLFRILGVEGSETAGIDLTVAITGNGSVTVTQLPTGSYTVTELVSWAWRYNSTESIRDLSLEYSADGTTIIYETAREEGFWLDGNAANTNLFGSLG